MQGLLVPDSQGIPLSQPGLAAAPAGRVPGLWKVTSYGKRFAFSTPPTAPTTSVDRSIDFKWPCEPFARLGLASAEDRASFAPAYRSAGLLHRAVSRAKSRRNPPGGRKRSVRLLCHGRRRKRPIGFDCSPHAGPVIGTDQRRVVVGIAVTPSARRMVFRACH